MGLVLLSPLPFGFFFLLFVLAMVKVKQSALIVSAKANNPRFQLLVVQPESGSLRISEALAYETTDLDSELGLCVLRIARRGGKWITCPLPAMLLIGMLER
jgi:hypothetical protein